MQDFNAVINNQKYERDFMYDNVAVLTTTFESFIVDVLWNKFAGDRINDRINAQLGAFMRDNSKNMFSQAVEVYNDSVANNFPIRPFESYLQYVVTYNAKALLSTYNDRYDYTGGAHGNTIRRSDTWSLKTGRVLPLSSFFPPNSDYVAVILKQIQEQAKINMEENPGIYFDNYPELILQYFNPKNYYLTENGIAIYYQQYEIAPYSSGIIVFEVKTGNLIN